MSEKKPDHLFESINLLITADFAVPGLYQVDYELVRVGEPDAMVFCVEGAEYRADPDLNRPSLLLAALFAWFESKI